MNITGNKNIDLICLTQELSRREETARMAKQAQDRAVQEGIPRAVQALRQSNMIEAAQEKDAAEALRDPVRMLEILTNAALFHSQNQPVRLGEASEKNAGYSNNPNLDPKERESDRVFREILLGHNVR